MYATCLHLGAGASRFPRDGQGARHDCRARDRTSFPNAIDKELKRWSAGKCRSAKTAKLRLTVSPHSVTTGHVTTFTFTVTVPGNGGKRSGFSGATVSFAGKKARTKTSGQATIKKSFTKRGTVKATATRRGLPDASTTVRVR